MNKQQLPLEAVFLVAALWLSACASSNSASGSQASATAPAVSMAAASMPGKSPAKAGKPVWTVPTEEEVSTSDMRQRMGKCDITAGCQAGG